MRLELHLNDAAATLELGRILATCLSKSVSPPALFLQGDLGSGKTTLVRGFVESLPGAEMAEVSSPSFNIFNLYPTTPPVAHFDLYRLEGMPPDEALFEHLDDPQTVAVVEWAQFLDKELWPEEVILLQWHPAESGRSLTLIATGKVTQKLVASLQDMLKLYT